MKLAIMQPYFMPYIGYFQAINAVDKYIISEHVNFIKGSWINKNRLRFKNNPDYLIIVPLKGASSNRLISELQIDNNQDWVGKILKNVAVSYKKAPFFLEVFPLIEKVLSPKYEYIHQLNASSIVSIARYLDIDTNIQICTDDYLPLERELMSIENGDYSLFKEFEQLKTERKVIRIVKMCRNEGAEVYINAIGGVNIYSREEFKNYGINLKFIKMDDIIYNQQSKDFISNLSIIDVLMHNGKEGTQKMLKQYTLI